MGEGKKTALVKDTLYIKGKTFHWPKHRCYNRGGVQGNGGQKTRGEAYGKSVVVDRAAEGGDSGAMRMTALNLHGGFHTKRQYLSLQNRVYFVKKAINVNPRYIIVMSYVFIYKYTIFNYFFGLISKKTFFHCWTFSYASCYYLCLYIMFCNCLHKNIDFIP